jgi:hypothetical protein
MFSRQLHRLTLAIATIAGITPVFAQAPPPVPALPDSERRTSYSISASTCVCSVGMQLYQDSTDYQNFVEVFLNGIKVAYNDTAFGWTITVPTQSLATRARPISDAILTFNSAQTGTVQIVGAQRPRRLTEVAENQGVAARDFNQFANGVTAQLREVWDRFLRVPRVPAGETVNLLPPLASRANMGVCFDTNGNFAPCVGIPAGAFTAGSGVTFTGTNPTTLSVATYSAGPGITFTGSAPTVISNSAPLIPSRANAATLNLTAYAVVQTQGYATPGDGGRAYFKNVGAAPFTDSMVTTKSITAGSGCTNGTYFGVPPSGGTGRGLFAVVTVAGNIVTAVDFTYSPGNAYTVGDVLALPSSVIGCSNASITVTGVSAPLGSFTDTVGTHFQIVNDFAVLVTQFGCKGDWDGTDAGSTDNFACMKAAAHFTNFPSLTNQSQGGHWGGRLRVPNGSYMICGTGTESLEIPQGVIFEAASYQAATIEGCATWGGSTNMVELCDPNWHFTCFGAEARDIIFRLPQSAALTTNTTAVLHSNNDQDFGGVNNVYIYSGQRTALAYETGFGGASTFVINHLSVSANSGQPQVRIGSAAGSGLINVGSTNVLLSDLALGGGSTGPPSQTGPGVVIFGGITDTTNVHCEQMPVCIEYQDPTGAGQHIHRADGINAGSGAPSPTCTGVIQLDSTNTPGNLLISRVMIGSCSQTLTNGQSGGTSIPNGVPIVKPITCVSGACT